MPRLAAFIAGIMVGLATAYFKGRDWYEVAVMLLVAAAMLPLVMKRRSA